MVGNIIYLSVAWLVCVTYRAKKAVCGGVEAGDYLLQFSSDGVELSLLLSLETK